MIGIDVLLVVIVLISGVIGVLRGLIREIISLIAWIVGLWCAWRFAFLVEPHLGGVLGDRPVSLWVARGLILIGILVVAGILNAIVGYFIRHSAVSWLDRSLGLLFGLIRGLVLVGLVAILAHLFKLDDKPSWHESHLTGYADSIGEALKNFVDDAGQSLKPPAS